MFVDEGGNDDDRSLRRQCEGEEEDALYKVLQMNSYTFPSAMQHCTRKSDASEPPRVRGRSPALGSRRDIVKGSAYPAGMFVAPDRLMKGLWPITNR